MSDSTNTKDLSSLIGSLLSNPAALSGVMNMLSGNQPAPTAEDTKQAENIGEESASKEAGAPALNADALVPLLGMMRGAPAAVKGLSPPNSRDPLHRRKCLLEAVRPYLSTSRCETLDLLIRILDILALLTPKK